MADMAAKADKNDEAYKIAHVVSNQVIMGPMLKETINWAINTTLLIMATSVPKPRLCFSGTFSPSRKRN